MNFFEMLLFVCALSCDALAASFAYGADGIKIPFVSSAVINLICSGTLGLSIILGDAVRQIIPALIGKAAGFTVLFLIACFRLLGPLFRRVYKKYNSASDKNKEKPSGVKLVFRILGDATEADADLSKRLSAVEAAALAVALSLDSVAAGFGSGLSGNGWLCIVLLSVLADTAAVHVGCLIGNRLAAKSRINLSWLGGAVLLILSFTQL